MTVVGQTAGAKESGNYFFTSESVSEGHPDKVADQVSDAILDAILAQDRTSRVAVETLVKTGLIVIAGEVTSKARVDYSGIAREVVKDIGYQGGDLGFDGNSCGVLTAVEQQSPDISMGVSGTGLFKEEGAGDQGMMFGYACDETPELMPATISYAHRLLKKLSEARRQKVVPFLRPDAKSQVTVEYRNGSIARVDTVVLSTQHHPDVSHEELSRWVVDNIVKKVIPSKMLDAQTRYLINPTGRFVIGGPQGDCGLTGRKIIVDTYGGHGAHGGGAFSGKDPTKVDRSAAYAARYIAKNLVAAGVAKRCLVQLAYAIGVAAPVSVFVETYGTSRLSSDEISNRVRSVFPLKPREIIDHFDLLRPIYRSTASYGHFGREDVPWEKVDKVPLLT